MYGTVDTKQNLLAKFYSAKHEENEDANSLVILANAVEKKLVDAKAVDEILCNMFYRV